jgi:hypothetical protein
MMKIEGSRSASESGSISPRHGSADPDPHQNVMDPQHWLLDINLIWFGYIARLSQWDGGEYFTRSNDFYQPSLA